MCKWSARNVILMMSGVNIIENRPKICYKKYLGDDWEPSYERPGSIVSNHQCWLDIMMHMYRQPPSHVAKAAVKKIPFVGFIADSVGCLFIDRGSKDQKKDMITQIADRQKDCEDGLYPPLILYPEGGTSNGHQLLQFKKGAFAGMRSVQPLIFRYVSSQFELECCVINFFAHSILASTIIGARVEVIELPVFQPNDYFFKHHAKEGEEKWKTYARVIRDIMAREGNLKQSDLQIEDKFEYKKQLYPKHKGNYTD